jgi:hypothetical protein
MFQRVYQRGGERARFDQQPVEAQAMVSACLEAHRMTGDRTGTKKRCALTGSSGAMI